MRTHSKLCDEDTQKLSSHDAISVEKKILKKNNYEYIVHEMYRQRKLLKNRF